VTVCASALSVHPVAATATGEVAGALLEAIGTAPDLVVVFASTPHTGAVEDIVGALRSILSPTVLVGCTAVSIAGGAQEIEEEPALSALAVRFTEGVSHPLPVRLDVVPTGDGEGATLRGLPTDVPEGTTLVLLADPFSFPADPVLARLAEERPDLLVLGGLASAARGPGGNRLVLDGAIHDQGAVGVLLPPDLPVTAVVSQGCRPIGQPMTVTGANGNLLESLASEPALPLLLRLVEGLEPADRALAARGLHLGRVVDETKEQFSTGDFLIRNVMGAVRERQAVAVGDEIAVGTTVQFQVRDAASADAELRHLLEGHDGAGALLFTCNGRGTHLFGVDDHDAELVAAAATGATAGMFCAGEIGPIGGRSFLHGFTASVLLFDR
jgi:small ligand-binding sensory domain FIST